MNENKKIVMEFLKRDQKGLTEEERKLRSEIIQDSIKFQGFRNKYKK